MSDSSGKSQSSTWEWFVALVIVVVGAIAFLNTGGIPAFIEQVGRKAQEATSSSRVITVCKKSSKDGAYSVTDPDGTRFVLADTVSSGSKELSAKEAYGVFEKGRAFQVRVPFWSQVMGENPQITWIESASKKLKPEEC